ncbi:MAG: hypothetical protein ACI85N_002005 [Gammaproteobacteria bacterium]|jgi:hypothetical protein
MGNRSKYRCKRRVRLTSMATGHIFATRFCAFRFATFCTKSLHKKLPVIWALWCKNSFLVGKARNWSKVVLRELPATRRVPVHMQTVSFWCQPGASRNSRILSPFSSGATCWQGPTLALRQRSTSKVSSVASITRPRSSQPAAAGLATLRSARLCWQR